MFLLSDEFVSTNFKSFSPKQSTAQESEQSSSPQELQNRLSGRFSAGHFGHWIISVT